MGFLCDKCSLSFENESVFRDHMKTCQNITVENAEQYKYDSETLLTAYKRKQKQLDVSRGLTIKEYDDKKVYDCAAMHGDCDRIFIGFEAYRHHRHDDVTVKETA